MNFKIGQKVVALCTYKGIKKDIIYVINDIYYCSCGQSALDVGIGHDNGTRCDCNKYIRNLDGVQWYYPSRFAPIIEDTNQEQQAEKAVKELTKEWTIEEPVQLN